MTKVGEMMKSRLVATGVASAALAFVATLPMAGPANAATPSGVCGDGYTVRASSPLGEGNNAKVYLLRNGNRACVVTFKVGGSVGNSVSIGAWVHPKGGSLVGDSGRYAEYAGPVKVTSSCVNWGGNYSEYSYKDTPC
ncbi:serine/threonine protein kinase [Streptomyces sp. p1417]|uniref:Serine/threonine protein kinase n=2 Tax=Streptomyces typhae TaxID=2681492 RepID=A0A6L6X2P2_9ACTN|nr:serine/threonine protein kinase [Streptomyces typhae]